MTEWFARPVLHVNDVEASLRFYIDQLGFTSPWRYDEDGKVRVAQVDRQACALILSDQWPEKIGKGLMFISSECRAGGTRNGDRCARCSEDGIGGEECSG